LFSQLHSIFLQVFSCIFLNLTSHQFIILLQAKSSFILRHLLHNNFPFTASLPNTGWFDIRCTNFSGELFFQKQLYKFIQTWLHKFLIFVLGSLLHAGIWRTKCLVSITSGRTHIAWLYVKLPPTQWWHMQLLLLKHCMQTEL
jgi:hypothetical protein